MTDLLNTWYEWEERQAPYMLDADKQVLSSQKSLSVTDTAYSAWQDVYSQKDFAKPGNNKLQLGILPHPYCGDVANAEVYLLMLNPGYGPHDYFAELEVPSYRQAALKNLKQRFEEADYPFYLLDPEFAWSGGFMWWHKKLAHIIQAIANHRNIDYAKARHILSAKIASIELIPYHSTSFYDADGWRKKLVSAQLAREFVNNYVLPKAERGEAIVIVTRQVKEWNLPDHPSITTYSAGEAIGAHLSPSSRGGRAMLSKLLG